MALTAERLRKLLAYDAETGKFTRLARTAQCIRVGDTAGYVNPDGYREIRVDGKTYKAHRLAWLYVHGAWPAEQIDHINGVRHDNRLSNLRAATNAENRQNTAKRSDNNSGFTGVSWHKRAEKWTARVRINRVQHHLGCFNTVEEAYEAYLQAKAELHEFQPTPRDQSVQLRKQEGSVADA